MTSRGRLVLLRLLLFEVAFVWDMRLLLLLLPRLLAVVDCGWRLAVLQAASASNLLVFRRALLTRVAGLR